MYGNLENERSGPGWWILALGAAGIASAAAMAQGWHGVPTAPELEKGSGCPATVPAHMMIVADPTDMVPRSEVDDAVTLAQGLADSLPATARVSVARLGDAYAPKTMDSFCVPALPRPGSINIVFQTRSHSRKAWAAFDRRTADAVEKGLDAHPANATPLLETITALSWRQDWSAVQPGRVLLIATDALQFYGHSNFYHAVDKPGVRADLRGVRVAISLIHRPEVANQDKAIAALMRWLRDAGVAEVSIDGVLQGEAPGREGGVS